MFYRSVKTFRLGTAAIDGDYYVIYRSRSIKEGGESEIWTQRTKVTGTAKRTLNYSWVALHSLELLRKFCNHMNVELYALRAGSIEYLFK